MCGNCERDQAYKTWLFPQYRFETDISLETQNKLEFPVTTSIVCNGDWYNVPVAIVIHYTRGDVKSAISEWRNGNERSAHYLITKNGEIIQTIPEILSAYHVSCRGNRGNCVPSCPICETNMGELTEPYNLSVGIELENWGVVDPRTYGHPYYEDYNMSFGHVYWDDYAEAQIKTLILLVRDIQNRWNIPDDMIIGHSRVNYKSDPGPALNIFWTRYGDPPAPPIFSTHLNDTEH